MLGKHFVRRFEADRLVLLSVISFASTVIITRLFLEITGYPQIGNGALHIAHVLWGGLLLFIAAWLPLVFINLSVLTLSALLSGIGVGLFIDEVGKFITRTNDYFYPPAASIIYGFFLLTVLLYLELRRSPPLQPVTNNSPEGEIFAIPGSSSQGSYIRAFTTIREQVLTRRRHRILLVLGLWVPEFVAAVEMILLIFLFLHPQVTQEVWVRSFLSIGEIASVRDLRWLMVRLWLDGVSGILCITGGILLVVGKEKGGVAAAILGLTLSLTATNLLVFYQDQFEAIFTTLVQFIVLLLAYTYRQTYFLSSSNQATRDETR